MRRGNVERATVLFVVALPFLVAALLLSWAQAAELVPWSARWTLVVATIPVCIGVALGTTGWAWQRYVTREPPRRIPLRPSWMGAVSAPDPRASTIVAQWPAIVSFVLATFLVPGLAAIHIQEERAYGIAVDFAGAWAETRGPTIEFGAYCSGRIVAGEQLDEHCSAYPGRIVTAYTKVIWQLPLYVDQLRAACPPPPFRFAARSLRVRACSVLSEDRLNPLAQYGNEAFRGFVDLFAQYARTPSPERGAALARATWRLYALNRSLGCVLELAELRSVPPPIALFCVGYLGYLETQIEAAKSSGRAISGSSQLERIEELLLREPDYLNFPGWLTERK